MIRPSALNIARHCQLSAVLSAKFPETNAAIERGNEVDRQVCAHLTGGPPPLDLDAADCVRWIRSHMTVDNVQTEVELREPDFVSHDGGGEVRNQGELITKGTPDVVGVDSWDPQCVIVCDLKKREQHYAGHLAAPDENLQLHAYALAHVLRLGYPKYRLALLLFGGGQAEALWSKEYTHVEWTPILDEIKRICAQERVVHDRPLVGKAGPHCTDCYPRLHCPHWALPAHQGESSLAALTSPAELTPEIAGRAYLACKAMIEMAERGIEILKGYRLQRGAGSVVIGDKQWGPVQVQGRKSVDIAALEADGLHQYVRKGQPSEQWRLTKIR